MKKVIIMLVLGALASVSQAVDVFRKNIVANLDQTTAWTNSAGGATVPTSSDVAVWNGTFTTASLSNKLVSSASWYGIRLGSTLSAGVIFPTNNPVVSLTLGAGGIQNMSAQTLNISTPIILGASQTWETKGLIKFNPTAPITDGGNNYSLTKTGTGGLDLYGANNFGDLFIKAGQLFAGSFGRGAVTLGDTSGSDNARISMNGNLTNALTVANGSTGVLSIGPGNGSKTISGTIAQNNTSGPLVFIGNGAGLTNTTLTISGVISGAGGVASYGAVSVGTTTNNLNIFSATNTYTGSTTVGSGALLLRGLLGSGSYAGNITNNGSLIYGNAGAQTLSGTISGTGSLTTTNTASTLTLSGANSYSGVTLINAGTLSVGNGSTAGTLGTGNVTNNASLIFNRSDALTADNAINGTGKLTKLGAGKLTLTAASGYTGNTLVSNGTLAVQGILQSAQTIVSAGATLMGTGTLQQVTLNAGSILAAGNSPGTMTFNGALTLAADSTNRMEITAIAYDILMGNGANALTLAGVTVFDFNGYAGGVTNGYTLSFNKLFQNWGSTNYTGSTFAAIGLGTGQSLETGSSGFTVIPEPATVGMLGLGAVITLLLRRMRS